MYMNIKKCNLVVAGSSTVLDEIIAINDKITLSVIYLLKGDNN